MASPEGSADGVYLNITVSDPIKRTDGVGMMSYTTYKVNTMTNRGDMRGGPFSVIRRFNDFKGLHGSLAEEFPGAIIPPLPEKSLIGRFEEQFVESRRRNLERFLQRVALHAELKGSARLVDFLTQEDAFDGGAGEAGGAEDGVAAAANAAGSNMFGWLNSTARAARTSISSALAASELERGCSAHEEMRFEELSEYVRNLETQMGNVAAHAKALKERNQELAKSLFDFGLAFTLLGQAEPSSLGGALTSMGQTADRLSELSTEQARCEALNFEDPLADYVRIVGAVRLALSQRNEKRDTYVLALQSVAKKEAAVAKVSGVPGKEDKVGAAEAALLRANDAADAAKVEFEKVSARVIREVERFKEEKAEDMRKISIDYIRLQVEHNQKVEEAWAKLLPRLEAVDLDEVAPMPPVDRTLATALAATAAAADDGDEEDELADV